MGDADIIYMDEWLRGHGRSVPMAVDGVALQWRHTPQIFTQAELVSMFDKGLVSHRTFTADEIKALDSISQSALDSIPQLNWPWHK